MLCNVDLFPKDHPSDRLCAWRVWDGAIIHGVVVPKEQIVEEIPDPHYDVVAVLEGFGGLS